MQDVMVLVDEAAAWVDQRSIYQKLPDHVPVDQKWVIRSALQKAVRRGQEDRALPLAFQLYVADPNYVWFALTTIANEDVGFASPDAVLWTAAAALKTFRRAIGELPLISALVVEMCRSFKTRSQCELSWLVDVSSQEMLLELGRMETADLIKEVAGEDAGRCYGALSVLRGMLPKGLKVRKPDPAGIEMACEVMKEQLIEPHARAAIMAFTRPQDNMSIAAFPAFRMAQNQDQADTRADELPPSQMVNGFASEAYDYHTREGKIAIKAFHTSLYKVYDEIQSLPSKVGYAAVGDAVFIEEGAQLDSWVTGSDLQQLRDATDEFTMERHKLPAGVGDRIREIVRKEIPRLNAKRLWAVGL